MLQTILRGAFNLIFGVALLGLLPSVFSQFIRTAGEFFLHFTWYPIVIGTVIGIFAERFLDRHFPEFAIFEHEITHALVGIPFGFIPTGITVSRHRGGECRHICILVGPLKYLYPITQRIVTLAPYFMPTFTLIMALFRPAVPPGWLMMYDVGIGVTFGYHTLSTLVELRENFTSGTIVSAGSGGLTKTDFGKTGMIFSPIFIGVATLAVHGFILTVIIHGYPGMTEWTKGIFNSTNTFARPLFDSVVKSKF